MSFGDRIETRSEFEAAELDRENRVSDGLAERRKDAVLVRIRMGEVAAEKLADACRRASYRAEDQMADAELSDEKRAQAEADYESLSWASRWLVAEEARCLEGVTDPEWEREHVEGWTRLLERAERCLSCDPDAGSSYVVAHAIRASIAAGTRKDDGPKVSSVRRWTVQSLPRVDLARPEQQLTGGIILSGPEVSSGTEVVDAVAYDALAVCAWELAEMLHRREVARGYAESVHSDPFDQCGARLCRETRSQCEAT